MASQKANNLINALCVEAELYGKQQGSTASAYITDFLNLSHYVEHLEQVASNAWTLLDFLKPDNEIDQENVRHLYNSLKKVEG